MKASFAVAFTYFSFVGLQKWLNWIFGALMAVGLVMELRAESSYSLGHGMTLSTLAAVFVTIGPAFASGVVMRIASTPTVLHLRPQGRQHMLVGATLAMTLAAVLISSPMLVAQATGIRIPSKATGFGFDNPGLSVLQMMWGGAALAWITIFALSRYQMLAAFSFVFVVLIVNVVVPLASRLPITADQFATIVFLTGVAAWIAFARWYLRTPWVSRPGWLSGWPGGKSAQKTAGVAHGRGLVQMLSAKKGESRAIALCHFLTGADSVRGGILVSVLMAMLVLADYLFSEVPPRVAMMYMFCFIGVLATVPIVRRSRLLWLRAGLNRNDLFLTAERQAWRAALGLCSLPMVVFMVMSLTSGPEQALRVMLCVSVQLAYTGCLLYAALAITRGWAALALVLLPFAFLLIFVDPETNFSLRAFPIVLAALGAIAIGVRAYARRRWLVLDWRLCGPPLPAQGLRGI